MTPEAAAANGRTIAQRLSALRLTSVGWAPTNAGLLIIGVEPTEFLPGAYVQFLRVDGTDLSSPIIDERRLTTALPSLLRELDELLRLNIRTSVQIGETLKDTRRADYPLAALQQLTRNAILHRSYEGTGSPVRLTWYDDRVEIYSPGGPYGVVTVENFGQPGVTDYRNPVLAEAMGALGYVQKFGAGLPIARRTLLDNSNPPARVHARPFLCWSHYQGGRVNAPVIAFFNNKGGVGKTSLVYHLAWMMADEGLQVVAADLDPQANLTANFLDEDRLEELWPPGKTLTAPGKTIYGSLAPLIRGLGERRRAIDCRGR
jgi:hypothetical protein